MIKNYTYLQWLSLLISFCAMLLMVFFAYTGCNADASDTEIITRLPASKAKPANEGVIVALGNSLTAGLGVTEELAYPARLARKLDAAGYRYQVINAGVSGETSSGALSRIKWVISSLKPDIVILETGANDGLRGIDPQHLEANLHQICTLLKEGNIQVLLTGMKMLSNLGPEYTRSFSAVFSRVAQKHPVVFMPFFLKDVAGKTDLNQPDNIHPTADGYARITDNIYPFVLEVIAKHRNAKKKHQE